MFHPLTLCIGLRYIRAKRRNHFISFMTVTSVLGIALGITVLITVLSVMNGFDQVIRDRIFSMAHQITVTDTRYFNEQSPSQWNAASQIILKNSQITGLAPFTMGQGLLVNHQQQRPVVIYGISPELEKMVSHLPQQLIQGTFGLQEGHYQIILGAQLAVDLGVIIGDKVTLLVPTTLPTAVGLMPRFKRFVVSGIFQAGQGFNFDSRIAYTHINDAQAIYQLHNSITGLRLKTRDLYSAPQIANTLAKLLPKHYVLSNWTDEYGELIYAIALEKTMMFCILLLLIAISAFNLVSSLMMVVTDKQADIAILRSLGAAPRTIMSIFMAQGSVIGLMGALLGLVGGIILAQHIATLISFIETLFHIQLFNANNYFFVDCLPSKIEVFDVFKVITAGFLMSVLATIYPAWRAARVAPAEALRYE